MAHSSSSDADVKTEVTIPILRLPLLATRQTIGHHTCFKYMCINRKPAIILIGLLLWSPLTICIAIAAPEPAKLFIANCAPCHGPDGRANTPIGRKIGVKDLTQSQMTEADITKQIHDGFKDAKGLQKMPAFGDRLSAEDTEAVAKYVKTLRTADSSKKD